jgi:hypothetical protein
VSIILGIIPIVALIAGLFIRSRVGENTSATAISPNSAP